MLRLADGSVIRARLDGLFQTGHWYTANAVRKGMSVVLQHVPKTKVNSVPVASDLGLPHDRVAEAIVRAFVREHLSLDPRVLQTAYRRVSRAPSERREERARLTAILAHKGLLESEELWQHLESIMDGDRGGAWNGNGKRQDRDAQDASSGPDGKEKNLLDGVASSVTTSDEADDLLQLFNHVTANDDHWILIPLRVGNDQSRHATLRVHVPSQMLDLPSQRAISYDFAILEVREGEEEWTFALRREGVGHERLEILMVRQKGRSPTRGELRRLETALMGLGACFRHEDDGDLGEVSDGFSLPTTGDIIPNADIEA